MKKIDLLMYGGLVIIAGVLIYVVAGLFPDQPAAGAAAVNGNEAVLSAGNAFSPIITGTTDSGDVAIELSPALDAGKLAVQFAANTHSVDLSAFDLQEMTTLQVNGKLIKPISVPSLSGHHVSGTLLFDTGGEQVNAFTITINGVPLIEERVFSWKR
ncbi:hypothetical protein HY491_00780 [Candidatus Woesearchaeota archaeon]|nr:hypothetical protein [Candidatus Woesearchaeota archaeon]